jgi:hypothetical protein
VIKIVKNNNNREFAVEILKIFEEHKFISDNTVSKKELFEIYKKRPNARSFSLIEFRSYFSAARTYLKKAPIRKFILVRKEPKSSGVNNVTEWRYSLGAKSRDFQKYNEALESIKENIDIGIRKSETIIEGLLAQKTLPEILGDLEEEIIPEIEDY